MPASIAYLPKNATLRHRILLLRTMSPRRHRLIAAFQRLRHRSLRHLFDQEAVIQRERALELQRLGSLRLTREDLVGPSSPEAVSVSPMHWNSQTSSYFQSPYESPETIASPSGIGDAAATRIGRLCSLACPVDEGTEEEEEHSSALVEVSSTPTSSLHLVSCVPWEKYHPAPPTARGVGEISEGKHRRGPFGFLAAMCRRLNPIGRRQGIESRAGRSAKLFPGRGRKGQAAEDQWHIHALRA